MRRFPLLALFFLLIFCAVPSADAAAPNGTVTAEVFNYAAGCYDASRELTVAALRLNGEAIAGEMPGVVVEGRTLAPLRLLAEALGAQVEWLPDRGQVQVTAGETDILLTLGAKTALVNGEERELPGGAPAALVSYEGQGYTMVPLRSFSETLGCRVGWDQGSYTACIYSTEYIDPLLAALEPPAEPGRFLVVLDAGHGGSASGASYEAVEEKDLNLAMAEKLRDILCALGYNTVMTREGDSYVGLCERAERANQAGADVFVSIHCNAAERSPDFQGLYVYHYPGSSSGARLARTIQSAACTYTGAVDRETDHADFVVLRETSMPAVLVEAGFMSCPAELRRLCDEAYQAQMARGIAQGVIRYLNAGLAG